MTKTLSSRAGFPTALVAAAARSVATDGRGGRSRSVLAPVGRLLGGRNGHRPSVFALARNAGTVVSALTVAAELASNIREIKEATRKVNDADH